MPVSSQNENTRREKALAWGVHLYTASGAVIGLLAIVAAMEENWFLAFIWMCITIFIDAVDGTLARRFRVKEIVPNFDGELLDNMVDYFTYVLVPALVLVKGNLVPENLVIWTVIMITLSSAYQFCQTDAKTDDHFFKGFPSYWNVLVIYLFFFDSAPMLNFAVLLTCAVLVFVPIRYVYPSRTKAYQKTTLSLNVIWAFAFLGMLFLYPAIPSWLLYGSLIYVFYYVGLSLYLTAKSRQ